MFHNPRRRQVGNQHRIVVVLSGMAVIGFAGRGVCAEKPRPEVPNPASVYYTPAGASKPVPSSTDLARAPVAAPAPMASITSSQLDTFAALLGEPEERVEQRLLWDPGLVPLATAAVDARLARKSQGKVMTIGGFTLLGVGVVAGLLVALSGPLICWDAACQSEADARAHSGEVIALASVGIGLALGVPGIVMLARQSEAEDKAVDRYQLFGAGPPPAFPSGNSRTLSTGSAATTFSLSLCSFAF